MKKILLLIIALGISYAQHIHAAAAQPSINDLYQAIKDGNIEQVKTLISQDIDVNQKEDSRLSVLWMAVLYNNTEIVRLLINAGADLRAEEKEDEFANHPLTFAIKYGNLEIVQMLVEKGTQINLEDSNGYLLFLHTLTPAEAESISNNNALIEVANPTQEDKTAIAKYLIEQDADIHKKDSAYSETLLHYATHYNNFEIVQLLVEKGANVIAKNNVGATPLHYAVENKNSEIVEFLCQNGARYSHCTAESNLHYSNSSDRTIVNSLYNIRRKQNIQSFGHSTGTIIGLGLVFADWYSYKPKKPKKSDAKEKQEETQSSNSSEYSTINSLESASSDENPEIKKEKKTKKTWFKKRLDKAVAPFIDMYKHPKEHKKTLVGAAITLLAQLYWYKEIKI